MPRDDEQLTESSARRWRDEMPEKKGLAREVRVLLYALSVAMLIGAVIAMFLWFWNTQVDTQVSCVPIQYYRNPVNIQDIPFVPAGNKDAESLARIFRSESLNLAMDKYFTKSEIISALGNSKTDNPDAVLVVYLQGFARRKADRKVYLLPGDSFQNEAEWIDLREEILQPLQKRKFKHQLLLLDLASPVANVFTGPTANDASAAVDQLLSEMQKDGTLTVPVITSCSSGEVSLPLWQEQRSVFGFYLEKGLQGDAAIERTVNVKNLHQYVNHRVNYWAVTCMEVNQQPRLYEPSGFKDFPIKPYVDHTTPIASTKPANVEEPAPLTKEEQDKKKKDEEAKLMQQVQSLYFPADLEEQWKERDKLLDNPTWMLIYPSLERWERQLLTQEKRYQANKSPVENLKATLPVLLVPHFQHYHSLLHGKEPSISPEDKEWEKQLTPARQLKLDGKLTPESPWLAASNSDRNKAVIIRRIIWEKLTAPGKLTAERLQNVDKLFQELKPVGEPSSPIECILAHAAVRKAVQWNRTYESLHADNLQRLLLNTGLLEQEISALLSNPMAFAACKQPLQSADLLLQEAWKKQMDPIRDRFQDTDDITDPLKRASKLLEDARYLREQISNGYSKYWEAVRILCSTSERVVNDANSSLSDAWQKAANDTINLGKQLEVAKRTGESADSALNQPDIKRLTALYEEASIRSWRSLPPAQLFVELTTTLLKTEQRKELLRDLMLSLQVKQKEIDKYDLSLLGTLKGEDPPNKPNPEQERAGRRVKMRALFEKLLPEPAAGLSTETPDYLQSLEALVSWQRSRLEKQLAMLTASNLKFDYDYRTTYTRAMEECQLLIEECKKQLPKQR